MMKVSKLNLSSYLLPVGSVWLFALYPVLALYAQNADQLAIGQLFHSALASMGASSVVFVMWLYVLKNALRSGLATMILTLLFWDYGLIWQGVSGFITLYPWHLIPLLLFIYIHLVWLITRVKQPQMLSNLNIILAVPMAMLVVFNLVKLAPSEYRKFSSGSGNSPVFGHGNSVAAGKSMPDIYFILLDEYASLQTVRDEWGYDNSGYAAFLKEKGFYIAAESKARYNQTTWNMPTVMGLDYLTGPVDQEVFLNYIYAPDRVRDLPAAKELSSISYFDQIKKWNNGALIDVMKGKGYKIIVLEGISQHYNTFHIWQADSTFSYRDIVSSGNSRFMTDAFYHELYSRTIVAPMEQFFGGEKAVNINYTGTKSVFNFLSTSEAAGSQPKFIYAHIMCPHIPYVFNRNGDYTEPINPDAQRVGAFMPEKNTVNAAYLEQYIYVNSEVEKAVEGILKNSSGKSPVIVIQCDHGPRPHEVYLKDPRRSFSIFNAVYFPDGDYSQLSDSIAPVNTWRVVLNKYLGTTYPMLRNN